MVVMPRKYTQEFGEIFVLSKLHIVAFEERKFLITSILQKESTKEVIIIIIITIKGHGMERQLTVGCRERINFTAVNRSYFY